MTKEGYELEAHDGHVAITTPVGKEIFLDEKKTAWSLRTYNGKFETISKEYAFRVQQRALVGKAAKGRSGHKQLGHPGPRAVEKTVKSEFSDGKRKKTENFHKGLHVSVIAGDGDEEEILVASQSTESKKTATESKRTAFPDLKLDDAREDAKDEDEEEVVEEDDEEPDNFDKDLDNFDKEPDQPERKLDKFVSLGGKRMILQQPVSYPARSTTDAEREEDKEEDETHQDQEEEADREHGEQEEIRQHGFEDQEETQAKTTSTTWRESNGLTERPSNERSAMKKRVVFNKKRDERGRVARRTARLMTKEVYQGQGVDNSYRSERSTTHRSTSTRAYYEGKKNFHYLRGHPSCNQDHREPCHI